MDAATQTLSTTTPDLTHAGLRNIGKVYYNLSRAELYEHTVKRGEGFISNAGALMCDTGKTTGRSPKNKFVIDTPGAHDLIDWDSDFNNPKDVGTWTNWRGKVLSYLEGKDVYVADVFSGAEPKYRIGVRVICERPFQALFTTNQFISLDQALSPEDHNPEWTVIFTPGLKATAEDGAEGVLVLVNFDEKTILASGTEYAGEIKKGIFGVMSVLMPQAGVMNMHCSANIAPSGKSAVFFGLSGTGKTSLSADPERTLIGDDEHGWHDGGVFNYEGGCYAKTINLSPEGEPEIWKACHTFGTVLENVGFDPHSRVVDYSDVSKTENTRCGYDIRVIPNHAPDLRGPLPSDVVFLTCDAFGVLPPISRLSKEQAMYYFLLGYTAKVAGTEVGVTEPSATFSTCFGAPFMMMRPSVYATELAKRIEKGNCQVWLLNTGWTGGAYGTGKRISIKYSRAMLNAAMDDKLDNAEYVTDPVFGLDVPTAVPGVPSEVLNPRETWSDKAAYDTKAKEVAGMFRDKFTRYEAQVSDAVKNAGPKG
jgi:phosphoenolpyruvate carboxykinase (ATP)